MLDSATDNRNNHLYSPHCGSSVSTEKQQKEKAEKIQ